MNHVIDLTDKDDRSLRNHAAPCDVSAFQSDLNVAGYVGDRPRFRIVWGQAERAWARGCLRIKYATPFTLQDKRWEWGESEEMPAGELVDVKIHRITAERAAELKEAGEGARVFHRLADWKVEWVGRPRWVIEILVEVKESPDEWNANRYEYHNEKPERWVPCEYNSDLKQWREDVLGAYETHKYQYFMDVCKPNGTTLGLYKTPDAATLEEFWRLVHAPALEHEYRPENAYKRAMAVAEQDEADLKASLDEFVEDHKYQYLPKAFPRVALYNPPVSNKLTKHGKAA